MRQRSLVGSCSISWFESAQWWDPRLDAGMATLGWPRGQVSFAVLDPRGVDICGFRYEDFCWRGGFQPYD